MIKIELLNREFEIHLEDDSKIKQITSLKNVVKEFNRLCNGSICFPESYVHNIICRVLDCPSLDIANLTAMKMLPKNESKSIADNNSNTLLMNLHVNNGKCKSIFYRFENIEDLKNFITKIQ